MVQDIMEQDIMEGTIIMVNTVPNLVIMGGIMWTMVARGDRCIMQTMGDKAHRSIMWSPRSTM